MPASNRYSQVDVALRCAPTASPHRVDAAPPPSVSWHQRRFVAWPCPSPLWPRVWGDTRDPTPLARPGHASPPLARRCPAPEVFPCCNVCAFASGGGGTAPAPTPQNATGRIRPAIHGRQSFSPPCGAVANSASREYAALRRSGSAPPRRGRRHCGPAPTAAAACLVRVRFDRDRKPDLCVWRRPGQLIAGRTLPFAGRRPATARNPPLRQPTRPARMPPWSPGWGHLSPVSSTTTAGAVQRPACLPSAWAALVCQPPDARDRQTPSPPIPKAP